MKKKKSQLLNKQNAQEFLYKISSLRAKASPVKCTES